MRHGVSKRHLSRTPAHLRAMRRNLAQSLFQYGEVETTLVKAKEVRPFAERLITLARKGTLHSRQRLIALLGDRSILSKDQQDAYDAMSSGQRRKVLVSRSGRRHRAGRVPASYNKKKFTFVAESVVNKLINDIAPRYQDRPGGYTRIIRLAKRRIGDNSDLAILQLVGTEETAQRPSGGKKTRITRRRKIGDRIRALEAGGGRRKGRSGGRPAEGSGGSEAARASKQSEPGEASSDGGGES